MTTVGDQVGQQSKEETDALVKQAQEGSSWAVLCLCAKIKPEALDDVLHAVNYHEVPRAGQSAMFDASCDGFAVYSDAARRRKL